MPDAIVIGGGFYGVAIATHLSEVHGLRVTLLERETEFLRRASFRNQARIHNGYHYPRSFTTAYRSRINLPKFVRDWPDAVERRFTKLYAIARRNSQTNALQFRRFCAEIGAKLAPAKPEHKSLFNPQLIEEVFEVEEYAFNAEALAAWAQDALKEARVDVRLGHTVCEVRRTSEGVVVNAEAANGETVTLPAPLVFNCTYSGLNHVGTEEPTRTSLKHEITELALVKAPESLEHLGITVMDGPFFSMMPFPARGLHSLSHVRYTPHLHWPDGPAIDPHQKLQEYPGGSRVDRMIRAASLYVPEVSGVEHVESLFEVKTVLQKNESDDGRPILFEQSSDVPGLFSVLGGKIDNVYDILKLLDSELSQRGSIHGIHQGSTG